MPSPCWKSLRLSFDLDRRVEQLFNELIHEPWGFTAGSNPWQPAVDVRESDAAYLLEADLPGVRPEDVELRVVGRMVTIRGRRESVKISHESQNVRVEREQGEFSRKIELEHPVDAANIETRFENGIFRARLPKTVAASSPHDQ